MSKDSTRLARAQSALSTSNGNGQHTAVIQNDGPIILHWLVYHEDECQLLGAKGLDVTMRANANPAGRHVVLLHGASDLYAISKTIEDSALLYRLGALTVKTVVIPVSRTGTLARLLIAGVLEISDLEVEAEQAQIVPHVLEPSYDDKGHIIFSRLTDEEMGMRRLSSIKAKRIEWLMPDRIPALAYTLIAGEGKQGKSQFTMAMGALISTGGEWWDGSGEVEQGHVLYLSAEDDAERVIKPRLMALGANEEMITILEARYKLPSKDDTESLVDAVAELSSLEYWQDVFRRVENPRVIFIDPLPSYIGRGVNDRSNNELRAVLQPFIRLAVKFGMTVIGVTHMGKSVDPTKPIANRVLDSIAYTNTARAVHFVAKDPQNPERKFFVPGPCNFSPPGLGALVFTLEEREVVLDDGSTVLMAVPEFQEGVVDVEAQDVVCVVGKKKSGPQSKVRQMMAEWLFDYLEPGLPVQAMHVYNDCAEAFDTVKPNPLGVKDEKGYWTKGRVLRKVAETDLPLLPYPRAGKRVDVFKDSDKRSYWRLVDNRSENGETTDVPY
jgi:hypothetical protein